MKADRLCDLQIFQHEAKNGGVPKSPNRKKPRASSNGTGCCRHAVQIIQLIHSGINVYALPEGTKLILIRMSLATEFELMDQTRDYLFFVNWVIHMVESGLSRKGRTPIGI